MQYRVLVAGCGRRGVQHLEAVAGLPEVASIEVYDPWAESLRGGQHHLEALPDRTVEDVRWMLALSEAAPGGDLCIIATQAEMRSAVLFDIERRLGYKNFLIEKSVAQSMPDYDALLELAASKGLSVWVHCPARAYTPHRRIKSMLTPGEPLTVTVHGGPVGLAHRGIHATDLLAFFDGGGEIEVAGTALDPKLHSTDWGADVSDVSGMLLGKTAAGSRIILSCSPYDVAEFLTVSSAAYRAVVDDRRRTFLESTYDSGWAWSPTPYDQDSSVVTTTRIFAASILHEQRCELPTLAECYPAHKFIISALLPHFEKFTGVQGRCPIA